LLFGTINGACAKSPTGRLLTSSSVSPLLSAITVLELMNQAKSVANSSYRYIEPITMVGAFFLAISLISVVALRWLEHRYGRIER